MADVKVLWICNGSTQIYNQMVGDSENGASWIDGLAHMLCQRKDINIVTCFPTLEKGKRINKDNFTFYTISRASNYYSEDAKKTYIDEYVGIIEDEQPDIVHLWGTEFPYVLYGVDAAEKTGLLGKTVINLQGMCGAISAHYYAQIPNYLERWKTFRDLLQVDSIKKRQNSFAKRALYESDAIKRVKYVVGRTDYDHAYAYWSNPSVTYFYCNEILRDSFYTSRWEYEKCEKYSIFISQAYYPIKGLHFLIEALALVKQQYPQVKLRIAGSDIFRMNQGLKSHLKDSAYSKYIKRLIKKYDLQNNIEVLGYLKEEEMCEKYLRSYLFVSASATENESNSLSEAKMLGMPVIASYVGGVANRVNNGYDALVYQYDDVKILAYYICYLFSNPEKAVTLGENARKGACAVNDKFVNAERIVDIYKEIINGQ